MCTKSYLGTSENFHSDIYPIYTYETQQKPQVTSSKQADQPPKAGSARQEDNGSLAVLRKIRPGKCPTSLPTLKLLLSNFGFMFPVKYFPPYQIAL